LSQSDNSDDKYPDDYLDLNAERRKQIECDLITAGVEIRKGFPHTGVCPLCNKQKENIQVRRLNTRYADDSENWLDSCHECYLEAVEHYRELWGEYYASQGF